MMKEGWGMDGGIGANGRHGLAAPWRIQEVERTVDGRISDHLCFK